MKLNVKHMRRLFPLLVYSTIFLCDDVLVVELPVDVIDGTSLLNISEGLTGTLDGFSVSLNPNAGQVLVLGYKVSDPRPEFFES